MEELPEFSFYVQPGLFEFQEYETGRLQSIPQLWFVAEALISTSTDARLAALNYIFEHDAAKGSTLITYILTTRIKDPTPGIRKKIIKILASLFKSDEGNMTASTDVKLYLYERLSAIEEEDVIAILQTVDMDSTLLDQAEQLFQNSSIAGYHLINIIADRNQPINIRKLAILYVGRIGYLDALPELERLENRLESKLAGQRSFTFTTAYTPKDTQLLPSIRTALSNLRAP